MGVLYRTFEGPVSCDLQTTSCSCFFTIHFLSPKGTTTKSLTAAGFHIRNGLSIECGTSMKVQLVVPSGGYTTAAALPQSTSCSRGTARLGQYDCKLSLPLESTHLLGSTGTMATGKRARRSECPRTGSRLTISKLGACLILLTRTLY